MTYEYVEKVVATKVAERMGLAAGAEYCGASQQTVANWCVQMGRTPLRMRATVLPNLDPYSVAEYYMCHTGADTAEHFDTTQAHVHVLVRKARDAHPTIFQYKLGNVPVKG